MSRGNITRRGKNSWRLKFDIGVDAAGKRLTRFFTVRGKRQDAEKELTRLLGHVDAGTLVEPSKTTVADYLWGWLGHPAKPGEPEPAPPSGLSPKTAERYRELASNQVVPHLGAIVLQKLRPAHVAEWHKTLLTSGSKNGVPLAPRTVGHAHRLLHRALERAVEHEVLARNVAAAISPPTVSDTEIEILNEEQIVEVQTKLQGHELYSIVYTGLASGLRRGELLALRLGVDLEAGSLRVERALEQTKAGLRFKPPKTVRGRRTLSLPLSAITVLREHRRKFLETRLALGLGRPDDHTLLFAEPDGSPRAPSNLTAAWRWACKALDLPKVSVHSWRHTHASALIASGLDVVTVSRRLGHANPNVTLRIYGHLFKKDDSAAANAIEAALRTRREQ